MLTAITNGDNMDITITALQLQIDGDSVKDHFATQLEEQAHSDYGDPYTEMELDSDGELRVTTTIHHSASMMIEDVEEQIRTGYLVDLSTGDFDEPGLCSMDKRQEMTGGRDYLFSYNVPPSTDEVNRKHEAELEQMRKDMELLRRDRDDLMARARSLEIVRQWFTAAQHHLARHPDEDTEIMNVNVRDMARLLDQLRWGDAEAVVPAVRDLVQTEISRFNHIHSSVQGWRTPQYRTTIEAK